MPAPQPKKEGFLSRHRYLVAVLLPLLLFAAVQPFVDTLLAKEETQRDAFLLLGAALLLFVAAEGLFFRFVLLPRMGEAIGEKIYAGSYTPAEDALVQLLEKVRAARDAEQLPELRAMVRADRGRLRGWLELARLLQDDFSRHEEALETMLEGADCVSGKEDRALLLYRAAQLCEGPLRKPERARELREKAVERYPKTVYGKKAAEQL